MVRSPNSYSNTNRSFSSITLLAFHGMPCFLHAPATKEQCQECSRSTLSGMSPVRTHCYPPSPPGFPDLFILKDLRAKWLGSVHSKRVRDDLGSRRWELTRGVSTELPGCRVARKGLACQEDYYLCTKASRM